MTTFNVLEVTDNTIKICTARLPTDLELKPLADWYRPVCLIGMPGVEEVEIKACQTEVFKTINRKATHSFPVGSNRVWILTQEEENAILAIPTVAESAEPKMVVNPIYADLNKEELKRKEKEYDRAMNEGAEGYNPYRDNYWIGENK